MTKLLDISNRAPEAIRKEIAERLGYSRTEELSPFVIYGDVSRARRPVLYRWTSPDGRSGEAMTIHEYGDDTLFPDWPHNPSAAFLLCCNIAEDHGWPLEFMRKVFFWEPNPLTESEALALSRLALAELQNDEQASLGSGL